MRDSLSKQDEGRVAITFWLRLGERKCHCKIEVVLFASNSRGRRAPNKVQHTLHAHVSPPALFCRHFQESDSPKNAVSLGIQDTGTVQEP